MVSQKTSKSAKIFSLKYLGYMVAPVTAIGGTM